MAGLARFARAATRTARAASTPRRDHRGLHLLVAPGAPGLLLRDRPALGQAHVGVALPPRLGVGGLGPGQLRLGRGQPRFGFADTTLGVGAGLLHADLVLAELLVQHGDLVAGHALPRLGLSHRRLGLLLAGPDLLIVQQRDRLTGLHPVALADRDLADASRGLRGDGGIVALDPSADRDHPRREVGRREEDAPGDDRAEHQEEQQRDDRDAAPPRRPERLGRSRRARLGARRLAVGPGLRLGCGTESVHGVLRSPAGLGMGWAASPYVISSWTCRT
jgi:hypothetical protein